MVSEKVEKVNWKMNNQTNPMKIMMTMKIHPYEGQVGPRSHHVAIKLP